MGVGLTACRIMALNLGGWIELRSAKGTTISIVICPHLLNDDFVLEMSNSEDEGCLLEEEKTQIAEEVLSEFTPNDRVRAPRSQHFGSMH